MRAGRAGGALAVAARVLALGLLVAALVVHHGAGMPGHGPAATPQGHGACASCDHADSDADVVLIACVAIGAAALLAPRNPGAAPEGAVIPVPAAPRAVPARASSRLRAPPPPPEIHRLCVWLR